MVQILPTPQPNRILIHKSTRIRFVIAHQVMVHPGFFIIILVLKSERLMCILINILILFQTSPTGVVAEPQEVAVFIGHLIRNADLVGIEIGEVLGFVFGVVKDLCQRFVAALVGVEIGVAAFVSILLQ